MKGGGAAIREVLMPAFGVLKNRQPFDPSRASRKAQSTKGAEEGSATYCLVSRRALRPAAAPPTGGSAGA